MLRHKEDRPAPLFFLHIPRTAGYALRCWLDNQFAASRIWWIDHIDPLRGVPASLAPFDMVGGHACYRFVSRFTRTPRVITFLRDPLDRALSVFYFFRQLGADQLMAQGVAPGVLRALDLSLADFLVSHPREAQIHLGWSQTLMLSRDGVWRGQLLDGADAPSQNDLAAARANLARCEFVGLTERMDESLGLVRDGLGWSAAGPIEKVNWTERRPARDDLDARTRQLLEEVTAPDRELYRFAVELFEQRLRRRPSGSTSRTGRGGASSLPESATLTFDQPIPGQGWLGREVSAQRHFCWMERDAWVELAVAVRGDMTLRCTALAAVAARQLARVALTVNGVRLATALHSRPGEHVFEAQVPAAVLQQSGGGPVRVGVSVAEPLRPCDELLGTTDHRRLGVAVHRFDLLPRRKATWRAA
jgi:hypothetical protein